MNIKILNELEILYHEGDKITGNEKVIRVELIEDTTCHLISDSIFKVSTKGLVLLQSYTQAIEDFKKTGKKVIQFDTDVNEWPKAKTIPEWIYFCKNSKEKSCSKLEEYYKNFLPSLELNLLVAFNLKYPNFYKKIKHGIQTKDSEGYFCSAMFGCVGSKRVVNVCRNEYAWDDNWWFALRM